MTAANLPREARALLDAIARGESDPTAKAEGISPYLILYGGGSFEGMGNRDGYFGFPAWPGKDNSHAAGRYQFQPGTWLDIVPHFGKFRPNFRNPDDQDWGAWFLAQQDFQARTGARLIVVLQAGATENIGGILKPTWTSMTDGSFPGRYAAALAQVSSGPAWVPAKPSAPPPPPAPPINGAGPVIAAARALQVDENVRHEVLAGYPTTEGPASTSTRVVTTARAQRPVRPVPVRRRRRRVWRCWSQPGRRRVRPARQGPRRCPRPAAGPGPSDG